MNLRTKFYHVTQPKRLRCTLALDVPSKSDLIEMMHNLMINCQPSSYFGRLGIALVHKNDPFNHKIGRRISVEKQRPAQFHLLAVERYLNGTVFKFAVETAINNSPLTMEVNLAINPGSQVTHIQFINVVKIKRI